MIMFRRGSSQGASDGVMWKADWQSTALVLELSVAADCNSTAGGRGARHRRSRRSKPRVSKHNFVASNQQQKRVKWFMFGR